MEYIKLVNEKGDHIGQIGKLEAHQRADLHEAFSILLFDGSGKVLLQQRNQNKYHSGGLWGNTCCSHVRVGESLESACGRALIEEMGIACKVYPWFDFIYRAEVGNELVEYEYDHVFWGIYNGDPASVYEEVMDWEWMDFNEVLMGDKKGKQFAKWFQIICRIARESNYYNEESLTLSKHAFMGKYLDVV